MPITLHPTSQRNRQRRSTLATIAALAGILAGTQSAAAATLVINATDDRTIRSTGTTPSATDTVILIGDTTTATDYLRGAIDFNLNNPLLAGATINSITLTLTIDAKDASSANENVNIDLHQLSSPFTESGVTWTSRNGTNNWTTAGGDYGSVIATVGKNASTVTGSSTLVFNITPSTIATGAAVDGHLYLLAKLATADEDNVLRNLFRVRSAENTGAVPALSIDYTAAVPEPNVAALLGGLGMLALVRRRR